MGKRGSVYLRLEQRIAATSLTDVLGRWRYGRELVKAKADRKKLPDGLIDSLILDAERAGWKVSRREIQYRVRLAEVYTTEAQLRKIVCTIGSWSEIIEAGFPPVEVEEVYSPMDLLDMIEQGPRPDPQEFEQLGMFPSIVKDIPLASSTLRHLVAYAEEMQAMTESFARRDIERQKHLRALIAAVQGDLDVAYPDAVAALSTVEISMRG